MNIFCSTDSLKTLICIDIVFNLPLEHNVFTDLTVVCVKEECKCCSNMLETSLNMRDDPVPETLALC
jgi:hypothetical protein